MKFINASTGSLGLKLVEPVRSLFRPRISQWTRALDPCTRPQEAPTPEQLAEIEALANAKIAEDVPLQVFSIDFSEAKSQYAFAMCDSFMPKDGSVTIAYLPAWNFNIVEEGAAALLASTGGVGRVEVLPFNASGDGGSKYAKGKLDVRFRISGSAAGAPRSSVSTVPPPEPAAIALLNPKLEKKPKKAAAADGGGGAAAGGAGEGGAAASAPAPSAKPAKPKAAAAPAADPSVPPPAAPATAATAEPPDSTPTAVAEGAGEAYHHGGEGQTITPWDVEAEGGIDYEKLIRVRRLPVRRADWGCLGGWR